MCARARVSWKTPLRARQLDGSDLGFSLIFESGWRLVSGEEDRACLRKPQDTCESLELSIVQIGPYTTEIRVENETQIAACRRRQTPVARLATHCAFVDERDTGRSDLPDLRLPVTPVTPALSLFRHGGPFFLSKKGGQGNERLALHLVSPRRSGENALSLEDSLFLGGGSGSGGGVFSLGSGRDGDPLAGLSRDLSAGMSLISAQPARPCRTHAGFNLKSLL